MAVKKGRKSRSHRSRFWSMKGSFRGVGFESGYEKKFLEQCYMLGIRTERCRVSVAYCDSTGKWHTYHPDFYWPDVDYVVEVKGTWAFRENHGFVREKYRAAVDHFRGRYTIVTEKELKSDFVVRLYRGLLEAKGGN